MVFIFGPRILKRDRMQIKALIFDLDGVIYLGRTIIPGAAEAIDYARKKGIGTYFLTNAGTRSRIGRVERLKEFKIVAKENEVYTSSYLVARYILTHYTNKNKTPNVFYIGEKGIREELEKAKIEISDGPANSKPNIVVVGLERRVTYERLGLAFRALINGADFIATNTDSTFPIEDGLLPGAGAFVKFLEYSSGKKPIIVGKPSTYAIETMLQEHKLKKDEVAIVGDRLDSDIEVGKKAGIHTILVLSGVTNVKDLEKLSKKEMPDQVIESIAELNKII